MLIRLESVNLSYAVLLPEVTVILQAAFAISLYRSQQLFISFLLGSKSRTGVACDTSPVTRSPKDIVRGGLSASDATVDQTR